jgi:hypothetical protein
MSRTSRITAEWADGEYAFDLRIGELRELETATRRVARVSPNGDIEYQYIGPAVLHRLLGNGEALTNDVRETLRIGLIGGGTKPVEASRLIKRYFDELPNFLENTKIAWLIVSAVLKPFEVEPLGESEEETGKSEAQAKTEQDASRSPLSTQALQ